MKFKVLCWLTSGSRKSFSLNSKFDPYRVISYLSLLCPLCFFLSFIYSFVIAKNILVLIEIRYVLFGNWYQLIKQSYNYIIDRWNLFLTCTVAIKNPECKDTTVSISLIDNCWTWDQSEIKALIGWFQSVGQNGPEFKISQLVGSCQLQSLDAASCSLTPRLDRAGYKKKSRQ